MKILPIISAMAALLFFSGCPDKGGASGSPSSVGVAMEPLAFIVDAVAGGRVSTVCALPPGRSAHDYEPSAREIARLQKCGVYFGGGLPYEKRLVSALASSVKNVDLAADASVRIPDPEGHGEFDPHWWLHPENNIKAAGMVAEALSELQPENREFFLANLAKFRAAQESVAADCRKLLEPYAGRCFYIQHPSLGYFALFCGLEQRAIEEHASGISARRLADLAAAARLAGVRGVLVQREANPAPARALAQAIDAPVIAVDPLGYDVFGNMRAIAAALKECFGNE